MMGLDAVLDARPRAQALGERRYFHGNSETNAGVHPKTETEKMVTVLEKKNPCHRQDETSGLFKACPAAVEWARFLLEWV